MDCRKYLGIGPRTRRNILKGKNIRKLEDGGDVFEDYWTDGDSDSEQSSSTKSNSNVTSQVDLNADSSNLADEQPATFVIPNSQQEFSEVNVPEIGNAKTVINKSSLLLKEVTEILPCLPTKSILATKTKNAAQMEEILPHYDEVDLQIMQIMGFSSKNEISQNHKKSLNDSTSNNKSKSIFKECTSKNEKESTDECNEDGDEYDLELLAKKLGKVASSNKISLSKHHPSDVDDDFSVEKCKKPSKMKRKVDYEKSEDSGINQLNAEDALENLLIPNGDDDFHVQKKKTKMDPKKKKVDYEENADKMNLLNTEDALENLHTSNADDDFPVQKQKDKIDSKKKKKIVNEKSGGENEINPFNAEDSLENLQTSVTKDEPPPQKQNRNTDSKKSKISKKKKRVGNENNEIATNPSENLCTSISEDDLSFADKMNLLNAEDALTSVNKEEPPPQKQNCNRDSKKSKISKKKKRVDNENNENAKKPSENLCTSISEDALSLHAVKEKVKNTAAVRKSSRQRYPPLASWRNERLLYLYKKNDIDILGIDKGTKEDDSAVKQLFRSLKTYPKELPKPKKAKLINTEENEMLSADILKRFSLIPWNITDEQNAKCQPYLIKRMFETHQTAFGFIQINVEKEKPKQYMPEDDVHLTVVQGEIELTIQKNSYKATAKDMFVVPSGCAYSIKNVGKRCALLSFAVGKFNFFENVTD